MWQTDPEEMPAWREPAALKEKRKALHLETLPWFVAADLV